MFEAFIVLVEAGDPPRNWGCMGLLQAGALSTVSRPWSAGCSRLEGDCRHETLKGW